MSTNLFDDLNQALCDEKGYITVAKGTTVPTDGTAGYQVGCLFMKTNGSKSNALFVNEGSTTSSDFNSVGGGNLITDKVTLTNAEIKALRATPKSLVAAPGAGYVLQFVSAVLKLKAGTNVLTESADNLAIKYTNGSGVAVSETIEATGFIDQSADTQTQTNAIKDAIVASASAENKALVLHNTGDGEYAGNAAADATMNVYITYRIVTV